MHYARLRKRGTAGGASPEVQARGVKCSVEGCAGAVKSRGLCEMHYARHRNRGEVGPAEALPRRGPDSSRWAGGRYQSTAGYWSRYLPDHPAARKSGYVYEHRLVAEEQLGRRLTADEVVHHINHDPSDNRPENLAVMTAAEHAAVHAEDRRRAEVAS